MGFQIAQRWVLVKLHANASGADVGAHVLNEAWPWLQLVMFDAAARARSARIGSAAREAAVKQDGMSDRLR